MRGVRSSAQGAAMVVLTVTLGACGPGTAADREVNMTPDARNAIVVAVDSATRSFENAERARDPEAAIAHLAPEFYIYADGVRTGYDDAVEGMRSFMGSLQHFEPGWENVEVVVLGPRAALSTFTFRDSIVTAEGELQMARGPTTLAWELRGDDWLIVYADADHYPVTDDSS